MEENMMKNEEVMNTTEELAEKSSGGNATKLIIGAGVILAGAAGAVVYNKLLKPGFTRCRAYADIIKAKKVEDVNPKDYKPSDDDTEFETEE